MTERKEQKAISRREETVALSISVNLYLVSSFLSPSSLPSSYFSYRIIQTERSKIQGKTDNRPSTYKCIIRLSFSLPCFPLFPSSPSGKRLQMGLNLFHTSVSPEPAPEVGVSPSLSGLLLWPPTYTSVNDVCDLTFYGNGVMKFVCISTLFFPPPHYAFGIFPRGKAHILFFHFNGRVIDLECTTMLYPLSVGRLSAVATDTT